MSCKDNDRSYSGFLCFRESINRSIYRESWGSLDIIGSEALDNDGLLDKERLDQLEMDLKGLELLVAYGKLIIETSRAIKDCLDGDRCGAHRCLNDIKQSHIERKYKVRSKLTELGQLGQRNEEKARYEQELRRLNSDRLPD